MNKAILEKKTGDIILNKTRINNNFSFSEYCNELLSNSNLAYGHAGNAKYILKSDVILWENIFRLCFYFENSKLSAIQFYLLSGSIKYEENKYPSDIELLTEFNLLKEIITFNFGAPSRSTENDNVVWQYENSILTLLMQNHDQSVYFVVVYKK